MRKDEKEIVRSKNISWAEANRVRNTMQEKEELHTLERISIAVLISGSFSEAICAIWPKLRTA